MSKQSVLIIILVAGLHTVTIAGGPLQPAALTCEYIRNPLGIDTRVPRLSWNFTASKNNQFQSAYEIIVSDNFDDIQQGKGNYWSTGKLVSTQSLHLQYKGSPLHSTTKYYWRVKVYNGTGEVSDWSEIAFFETAMLDASDWTGEWINDGSIQPAKNEDFFKDDRMPLFRKLFLVGKKMVSARLYISGLGYYEAFLNGQKISDHVLDPGFTTYVKQALYVVHDITSLMKKGYNVAGIQLGNGWWNPLPFKFFGRWDLHDYQQSGRPCVKAEIQVHYSDGTIEKIVTNESWQTIAGPILRNNIYIGETYDARLEQKDWMLPKTSTGWKNAVAVRGPSGMLTFQMQPAIKVTRIIRPISIREFKPRLYIIDMGQNFAGVARIKVKGPSGTKITMRFGEALFADSSLNVMTSVATQIKKGSIRAEPGSPETMWQEDNYILKGGALETWQPKFTFHGFRYIEVSGWPGKPTLDDFEGLRMNSAVQPTGSFSCSNDLFNKLHEAIQWTFLSNIFSVQSDCPAREKMGYGADMVVSANAFMYNYDMANFYSKSVRDFANEQRPKGGMTEIAPFTGIADRGYGDLSGPLGWQLAFLFLQKQLYEFYGDKRIIETYYPALQKQIAFLQTQARDNLFDWDISDHEALDPKPEGLSASAFYYHHVKIAAEFASLLDNKVDSARYQKLAQRIKESIIEKYLIPTTGRFDNSTQSAQLFALWYEFSPEKEKSFDVLLKELERHHWHISTGIFSTQMFFDIMRLNNRNDIAYRIANQKDFPGWGFMLENEATTLWETWNFPGTVYSMNHPMFGSIDEWFYRSLLGINAASPGFEKIIIKPQPVDELSWAKGTYQSIRGLINVEWKKNESSFLLNVSIPPNTTAEIWIPGKKQRIIKQDGITMQDLRFENGYAITQAGSGNYIFSVN
ncbi:MAG: family 78 glycoside hydrolase catalytic domain [Chitinophagaceae bacterium]